MDTLSITANNETRALTTANAAQHVDIAKAQGANLCQYWPGAKAALQILLASANAFLKIAIGVVIAAGDAVCPGN